GDSNLRSRIVLVDPALEARHQVHLRADPRLIDIVRIPELPRRTIPQQLHRGAGVVSEFAALRVTVDGKDIQDTLACRDIVLVELLEKPGQVVHASMRIAVRMEVPAMLCAILLVVPAVEVTAP